MRSMAKSVFISLFAAGTVFSILALLLLTTGPVGMYLGAFVIVASIVAFSCTKHGSARITRFLMGEKPVRQQGRF